MSKIKVTGPGGLPEWFSTYSGVVTLLLIFFILLFSMASVDNHKFSEVAKSLSGSFSEVSLNNGGYILSESGKSILSMDFTNSADRDESVQNEGYIRQAEEIIVNSQQQISNKKLEAAKDQINQNFQAEGIQDRAQVAEEKDYVLVRLDAEVFFDSGSAEIRKEGIRVLDDLANVLKGIDNQILVSGHTDNVPVNTPLYKSNWDLSTARATVIVRYLTETSDLDPTKFTAAGNGEFQPTGDNSTPQGRQQNRRIEIRIMK